MTIAILCHIRSIAKSSKSEFQNFRISNRKPDHKNRKTLKTFQEKKSFSLPSAFDASHLNNSAEFCSESQLLMPDFYAEDSVLVKKFKG